MSSIPNWYKRGDNTNKNRRQTMKDRAKRIIDNSSMPGNEKLFVKQAILSIMQEYAELWEHRLPKTEEKMK